MARPREFDKDEVLDKIIKVFWEHGFEGTSFANLEKETGLKKGSLFAAYGDKATLFCLALKRYQNRAVKSLEDLCDSSTSARVILEKWLSEVLSGHVGLKGCFSLNSSLNSQSVGGPCEAMLIKYWQNSEMKICEIIKRGMEAKQFSKSLNPACAARHIVWFVAGVNALSRLAYCKKLSEKEVQLHTSYLLRTLL